MPNLRVVYDNAADRATLGASSTAGALPVTNLRTQLKSQVWRATGTSATITATWPTPELVACVVLPFCNLTSTATMRVRGYALAGDTVPAFDTGARPACPYAPLGLFGWGTQSLGCNAFAFGGGTYAVAWFAHAAVEQLVIDLADPDNAAGYIEASRLVAGAYWSPTNNVDWSPKLAVEDSTTNTRNDAGDLITDRGTKYRTLAVSLSWMPPVDRDQFMSILRGSGFARPVFVSLFPESADPLQEQQYQIWGKLSDLGSLVHDFVANYTGSISIQEA
ncbi:hypothetical protein C7401_13651 [Paraburkholderia unamae]|uniref:hypothetical protein n=1 Tax=Paraburkholderia unamae TaxID=219649 RepID=UPI000DC384D9|nr:hypothetical protein [Paraburkholderia unamae]RAR51691.1 hypothetical protein C7401_13651 [Paraburkholderia unamae]